MNVINGLRIVHEGGSPSPYACPARNARRMLWRFLHTVIGWGDHDKSGAQWDNPIATGSDGATNATDKWQMTSATGGFTTAMIGYQLTIHPTDATAGTAGGFSDPTRNGIYQIVNVLNGNTLVLQKGMGVHADDGLPLNESSLHFTIDDFRKNSLVVADNNWAVLEGEYTDTTKFHLRLYERYSSNYGRCTFQIGPWADWDAAAHAWKVANRVSAQREASTTDPNNSGQEEYHVYAGGDKTWFWFTVAVTSNGGFQDLWFYSAGEFDPYHAADVKPCYAMMTCNPSEASPWAGIQNPVGVNIDGSVPLQHYTAHMVQDRETSSQITDSINVVRSTYSGRHPILPILILTNVAGYEAIRGEIRIRHGLRNTRGVGNWPYVFGTNGEYLHLYDHAFPWLADIPVRNNWY